LAYLKTKHNAMQQTIIPPMQYAFNCFVLGCHLVTRQKNNCSVKSSCSNSVRYGPGSENPLPNEDIVLKRPVIQKK